MIYMAGKNKLIEVAEELFSGMEMEGLQPNSKAYAEIIGAFLQVERVDKAMEIYKSMKDSGCRLDELTFTILIRNLEKPGKHDLASNLKKECEEFLESSEKFLEEVNKKYVSIYMRIDLYQSSFVSIISFCFIFSPSFHLLVQIL